MASHLNPIFKPGWKTNCVSKSGCMVWVKANIENPFKSGQPVFKHLAPLGRRVDIPYVGLEPVKGKEVKSCLRWTGSLWLGGGTMVNRIIHRANTMRLWLSTFICWLSCASNPLFSLLIELFVSPFWITYNPIFTQHGH